MRLLILLISIALIVLSSGVSFEVAAVSFVRRIYKAVQIRTCPRTALDTAFPLNRWGTEFGAKICSRMSCIPEHCMICPMHPRKLISMWNGPSLKMIFFSALSTSSERINLVAFHLRGWSKVTIGSFWYFKACSDTKCKVEKIHVSSEGFISIIVMKITVDFPGNSPFMDVCPFQDGRL